MIPWTCVLLSLLQILSSASSQECPPCDCNVVAVSENCTANAPGLDDPCSCCLRCNRQVGEACGGLNGRCAGGLFCLPDDPFTGVEGTCYGELGCLTFGCEQDSQGCSCFYNTSCPTYVFPFFTIDDCEQDVLRQRCANSNCSLDVDQLNCLAGSIFVPGGDECCPLSGSCLCNASLCDEDPWASCSKWTQPVLVLKANETEGRCCDEYTCEKIPGCVYSGSHYEIGEEWLLSLCEKCVCTDEGEICTATECEPVDCAFTYIPARECCPICADDLSATPFVGSVCIALDGQQYGDGERWLADPCTECYCSGGASQCVVTSCSPLVCMNASSYYVPDGMCCPMCKDEPITPTQMPVTRLPPQHPSNQPEQTEEPMTSQTQLPTSPNHNSPVVEIVLMLNLPYDEVVSKLSDFSARLSSKLGKYFVEVGAIAVIPHNSSKLNTLLSVVLINKGSAMLTESELVSTVTQTAEAISLVQSPVAETSTEHNDTGITVVVGVLAFVACASVVFLIGAVLVILWLIKKAKRNQGITLQGSSIRPRSLS